MQPYIPKENARYLKEFKYSGGTSSITYQYIWSPFAEFLLRFVPRWVAPNIITLSGLIILIIAHIATMLPDQGEIAPYKLIMTGISIFMYQQLDNMDGKQARRTNSSSPLGMLFDHGTDAIVAYLVGLQAMKLLHLDYGFQIILVPTFLMTQYFCAMWSQYCIGYFKLGRVNPIDQGLPLYASMFIVGSQVNLSFMSQQHWLGTYGQEFMYFLMVFLVPQLIVMTKDIFIKSQLSKSQIMFMTLLFFCSSGTVFALHYKIDHYTPQVFFFLYYSIMFMWCRNMILIQIQFITKQKYKVFNRGTNSFIFLSTIYIFGKDYLPVSDQTYFMIMLIITAIVFFEFIFQVFTEAAQILDIRIFSLKKRQKTQ